MIFSKYQNNSLVFDDKKRKLSFKIHRSRPSKFKEKFFAAANYTTATDKRG